MDNNIQRIRCHLSISRAGWRPTIARLTARETVFVSSLEKVGGNEQFAFEEFFRLLPKYIHDLEEVGSEGVCARYGEVMEQIRGGA